MKKIALIILCVFCLPLAARDQVGNYAKECMRGSNTRITFKHREHSGLGYDLGYSTLGVFLSPTMRHSFTPFIDLRGHRFTDGKYAANAGLGFRVANEAETYSFGGNIFWDYRQSDWIDPQQVGAGFEILGNWVDFRANGYYPIGQKKATRSAAEFGGFHGRGYSFKRKFRVALPLAEMELGVPWVMPFLPIEMYFALGSYYLVKENAVGTSCGDKFGGKTRLTARLFDGVQLGVEATYDREFQGNVQGFIALSFPLGPANMKQNGSRWKERYSAPHCDEFARVMARQAKDVQRNEIIPICRGTGFYNPGIASNIIFVNNESFEAGDGTFEDPYATLTLAQANSSPGDTIYVIAGVGDNPYEEGIVLQNSQRLQGSGKSFILDGIDIPPLTPGSFPIISNPTGSGAVLADSTTVFGIHFFQNFLDGVQGSAVSDVTVQCNTFKQSGMMGLSLLDMGGINTVTENEMSGNFGSGVEVSLVGGGRLEFTENTLTNNSFSGATFFAAAGGSLFNIENNFFDSNDQFGIEFSEVGAADALVGISMNGFTNHKTAEVEISTTNGSSLEITNNVFTKTAFASSQFIHGTAVNGGMLIESNTLTSSQIMTASAIQLDDDSGTTNSIFIQQNTITASQSGAPSIKINIDNPTDIGLSIKQNTITNGPIGDAIAISMTNTAATWNSLIANNFINTGSNGISMSIAGRMVGSIDSNIISSSSLLGIDLDTITAATARLCMGLVNNNAPFYDFDAFGASVMQVGTNTGDITTSNNFSPLGNAGFSLGAGVTEVVNPAVCPP